jgi:hypothetical protein
MKYLVLLLLLLPGCGNFWGDNEQRMLITSAKSEKKDESFKGALKTEYPAGSTQKIDVTASGNSTIHVSLPSVKAKGKVSWQTKQENDSSEESEEQFSIDKWIKSVSTAGWAFLVLSVSVLLFAIVYFIRRTAIGKAADAALGATISATQSVVHSLNEKLMHMDPKSSEWNAANEMREKYQRDLTGMVAKQKPKGDRYAT